MTSPEKPSSSESLAKEIDDLFEADQSERLAGVDYIDFEKVLANDAARLGRAREIHEMYMNGELQLSGKHQYQLAILFQHSTESSDYQIAQTLAEAAAEAGHEPGGWLVAAAEDRYLLSTGKKQVWGTQFKKNETGEWELADMEDDATSGITDEKREERGIPKRADLLNEFLKLDN